MAYIRTGGGGKPEPELLWTNPNPRSDFNAQTVSLDLSEYDTILIKYSSHTGSNYYGMAVYPMGYSLSSLTTGMGYPELIMGVSTGESSDGYGMGRFLTISETGIEFRLGKWATGKAVARSAIPLEIYGLKATVYPS